MSEDNAFDVYRSAFDADPGHAPCSAGIAAVEAWARADERAKVLAELGLHEDGGCILNEGGTCVLVRCVRR